PGGAGGEEKAGGKPQSCLLSSGINRSEQATASYARPSLVGIDNNLPHPGKVYHHTIAGAETCEAMTSTANGGKDTSTSGGANRTLNVGYISAASDQPRSARGHPIPDGTSFFVASVGGTQQVAFELWAKRREDFFAGISHLVLLATFKCSYGRDFVSMRARSAPENQQRSEPTIANHPQ